MFPSGKKKNPPEKFYKIGEVSKMLAVKAFVIRFWEEQFSLNHFKKKISKQRRYSEKDIQLLKEIKELLYEKKFTISGAKEALKINKQDRYKKTGSENIPDDPNQAKLIKIREKLKKIHEKIPVFL